MRAFLLLALLPMALLSGCLESNASGSQGSEDDGVQSSSVTCMNDRCTVCADETCAPCERDECDECRDGDCPAFARAGEAAANATPAKDVGIQKTYPLTMGLAETTWTFDVAPGATGHAYLFVRDSVTKEMEVMGSACVSYEVEGANHYQKGNGGSCANGNNIAVSGSTNTAPQYFLAWESLEVAHYTITASADDLQANELVVDIVVDNP